MVIQKQRDAKVVDAAIQQFRKVVIGKVFSSKAVDEHVQGLGLCRSGFAETRR
ncbi:MAG: hypothetical protein IIC33_07035 [Chloroflexi bacterium]|nr:hypothetical protein [Chloroflexota bacterium]